MIDRTRERSPLFILGSFVLIPIFRFSSMCLLVVIKGANKSRKGITEQLLTQ